MVAAAAEATGFNKSKNFRQPTKTFLPKQRHGDNDVEYVHKQTGR